MKLLLGEKQSAAPFNLEKAEVIRADLVKLTDLKSYFFLITVHHVACDFDSVQLIFKHLERYYYSIDLQYEDKNIEQFRDLVITEINNKTSEEFKISLHYWKSQIIVETPLFSKIDATPSSTNVFVGKSGSMLHELGLSFSQQIFQTIQNLSITPHNFFLALFTIIVASRARRKLFQVGMPVSKRKLNQPNMLGMLTDTYWVHVNLDEVEDFPALTKIMQKRTLAILPHVHCGFYDLLEAINLKTTGNGFPIFQVFFNWVKSESQS